VFSLQLLRTPHEQCTRGSISKEAGAGGLRAAFEADTKMVLRDLSHPVSPDITEYSSILIYAFIRIRDAYNPWVAMKYQVDTMIASGIEEADQGTAWKVETCECVSTWI
jgi:hypothetical protein